MNTILAELLIPLQADTRVDVFEEIFIVFLGLGTLVGVVVVAYMLYNAYKYRDDGTTDPNADDVPTLGELPTGGKGGKKLFVSFGLSAIIVISLVIWTYTMLLYVETGPNDGNPGEDALEVDVEGVQFYWDYHYVDEDVESTSLGDGDGLVVPADTTIWVNVTGNEVWHAFGIPDKRVKADAIPGEHDQTWFIAEEPGVYEDAVECFELCGDGHSDMKSDLVVLEEDEFEEWLEEQAEEQEDEDEAENDDGEATEEAEN